MELAEGNAIKLGEPKEGGSSKGHDECPGGKKHLHMVVSDEWLNVIWNETTMKQGAKHDSTLRTQLYTALEKREP